jgi:hypothetical protein
VVQTAEVGVLMRQQKVYRNHVTDAPPAKVAVRHVYGKALAAKTGKARVA